MQSNSSDLARLFAGLVGTGPGAGMSLQFIFAGLALALTCLVGYAIPAIREVESRLPDHDHLPPPAGQEKS
jgi:hypothetical protein